MIYVMIASEADKRKRADMIMKLHKFLWKISFSNKKSGVSDAFHNLGPLVLFADEFFIQ